MNSSTGRELSGRRRRQARVMRVINVPMRWLLSLPFPTPVSGRLMLLYYTGRRTGRLYRQPLSYVRIGDTMLTPGGGNWKLSLGPDEPTRLRLRGCDILVRPEFLSDPTVIEHALDSMTAVNPRLVKFVPISRLEDGHLDPDALQKAISHGFCIVRWNVTT